MTLEEDTMGENGLDLNHNYEKLSGAQALIQRFHRSQTPDMSQRKRHRSMADLFGEGKGRMQWGRRSLASLQDDSPVLPLVLQPVKWQRRSLADVFRVRCLSSL